MRIPTANLRAALEETREDWQARLDALIERNHYILGSEVVRFEARFAESMGAKEAVGVSSGSTAIELCLRDAGVKGEVLTSALTAPFTAVSIAAAGATPKFADVDTDTLQVSPDDLGNRITKKTQALVPVHLYGQPCQIDRIAKLSKLPLIQDACQSHGARWHGSKALAAFGDYVAYSFYPTKNLGCLGDGGAIVTNKASVAKRLRQLRDGGRKPGTQIAELTGINARLDELQACFLNAFVERLEAWNARRRDLAALYDEGLRGVDGIQLVKAQRCSVRHLYVVRAKKRDRLRRHLESKGILTGIHYPVPLHLHPAFAVAKQKKGSLPVAEKACQEIVSLPLFPHLEVEAVKRVIEEIRSYYG
jgi:dTDP-3-amino-3,4,6-trideoxy-alpha-D-glucose transaminase